jgi:prevent-host-death family protein
MKLSEQVKPISYLKANAPEVIAELARSGEPIVITVHGEAKAVLQDIASFEQTQETLALLKILALGNKEIERGEFSPLRDVLGRLRKRGKG